MRRVSDAGYRSARQALETRNRSHGFWSTAVVSEGEKVHVVIRRHFEDDLRRHFAGVVVKATDSAMRVAGYAFVYDQSMGAFVRRAQQRTQLFGLSSPGLIVTIMPETVKLDNIRYETDTRGKRILTDGNDFRMNISDFGVSR